MLIFTHKVGRLDTLLIEKPATATKKQPPKTAPNEPARPIFAKMYIFWGQNGLLGAKIAIIGPNILFFREGPKVLVTTYQKTTEATGDKIVQF